MKYYIYLLQIFGGGNPKIQEIIRAYGSAKAVYEKVSSGDMTLIPSNRIENAKRASLESSERIITFCKNNKITIITIDDKAYPTMLKHIYNPPTVLFVEGDLSCLNDRLSISVVGPRRPDTYAVRLGVNICGGLAGCNTVLVSGFANGIDSIAHGECIKRNIPTVAVLACGHTVEYPAHTFGLRAQIKKAGGAVISELLPDTECCPGYFKFRNRIISGLTYGTVIVGGYNRSGSLHTANSAFEQDRDLFFTLPADTLDENYTKIVRFLRDGAIPVYDFYDVINEYYEMHKDKLDDTYLDKNRLTSYSCMSKPMEKETTDVVDETLGNDKYQSREMCSVNIPDSEEVAEFPEEKFEDVPEKDLSNPEISGKIEKHQKPETYEKDILKEIVDKSSPITDEMIREASSGKEINLEDRSQKKAQNRKKKKIVPPDKRFFVKATGEKSPAVDYEDGTPSYFLKRKKKSSDKPKTPEQEIEETIEKNERMTTISEKILDVLRRDEAATIERLMSRLDVDFASMTEYLADLEVEGLITYHPGGVYTLGEES